MIRLFAQVKSFFGVAQYKLSTYAKLIIGEIPSLYNLLKAQTHPGSIFTTSAILTDEEVATALKSPYNSFIKRALQWLVHGWIKAHRTINVTVQTLLEQHNRQLEASRIALLELRPSQTSQSQTAAIIDEENLQVQQRLILQKKLAAQEQEYRALQEKYAARKQEFTAAKENLVIIQQQIDAMVEKHHQAWEKLRVTLISKIMEALEQANISVSAEDKAVLQTTSLANMESHVTKMVHQGISIFTAPADRKMAATKLLKLFFTPIFKTAEKERATLDKSQKNEQEQFREQVKNISQKCSELHEEVLGLGKGILSLENHINAIRKTVNMPEMKFAQTIPEAQEEKTLAEQEQAIARLRSMGPSSSG